MSNTRVGSIRPRSFCVALIALLVAARPMPARADAIQLVSDGGVFLAPVHLNDSITLNFVVDSGAADVSIPADVMMTLFRTNTVTKKDFIGTLTYQMADGSTLPSKRFVIHEIRVGKVVVHNVVASVAPVEGVPLLGQSFLSRVRDWHIDNDKRQLVLGDVLPESAAPTYALQKDQPTVQAEASPAAGVSDMTLPQTLAFIRTSLASQGPIAYAIAMHDMADGSDWSQSMTGEATNVEFDARRCRLTYHWRTSNQGKVVQDFDATWPFAEGVDATVISRADEIRSQASAGGHPGWTAVVSPPIWVVSIRFGETSGVANFTDARRAEAFSKAVERAMDLCGSPGRLGAGFPAALSPKGK